MMNDAHHGPPHRGLFSRIPIKRRYLTAVVIIVFIYIVYNFIFFDAIINRNPVLEKKKDTQQANFDVVNEFPKQVLQNQRPAEAEIMKGAENFVDGDEIQRRQQREQEIRNEEKERKKFEQLEGKKDVLNSDKGAEKLYSVDDDSVKIGSNDKFESKKEDISEKKDEVVEKGDMEEDHEDIDLFAKKQFDDVDENDQFAKKQVGKDDVKKDSEITRKESRIQLKSEYELKIQQSSAKKDLQIQQPMDKDFIQIQETKKQQFGAEAGNISDAAEEPSAKLGANEFMESKEKAKESNLMVNQSKKKKAAKVEAKENDIKSSLVEQGKNISDDTNSKLKVDQNKTGKNSSKKDREMAITYGIQKGAEYKNERDSKRINLPNNNIAPKVKAMKQSNNLRKPIPGKARKVERQYEVEELQPFEGEYIEEENKNKPYKKKFLPMNDMKYENPNKRQDSGFNKKKNNLADRVEKLAESKRKIKREDIELQAEQRLDALDRMFVPNK